MSGSAGRQPVPPLQALTSERPTTACRSTAEVHYGDKSPHHRGYSAAMRGGGYLIQQVTIPALLKLCALAL